MGDAVSSVLNVSTEIFQQLPLLLQPENSDKKYEALFVEIDSGQTKLPMFQREFVWDKDQSAKLIDSILKGFPIGTFIFWKTKEELRSYKNLGNHHLPETPKGDYVQYVLDGQQRITSLYAIRKGIRLTKEGEEIDYKDIFIDLDFDPKNDEQIVVTDRVDGKRYVSVHRVLSSQIMDLLDEFQDRNLLRQIEEYKGKLINYDFSSVTIKDYPLDVACEVFTRINTGGKSLTVFEIMVAKTFDEAKKFDLSERYEVLRDGSDDDKECLALAKFETIAPTIAMQAVSALVAKAVRSKDILKIRREKFIENWEPMKTSLFMAVDFVRSELRVPVSQLIPYPAVLVPFTYFFHITSNKKPTTEQVHCLEQFFYWAGLTERYGSGSEGKIVEDFERMEKIAKAGSPSYPATELSVDAKVIAERWFSAGNAYCKTILCLLAYQQPKSFDTNGMVILDNSNLRIATSRNYHHFFSKDYLGKNHPDKEPNLIANICLIDGYSNKHRIGSKSPSLYLPKFAKKNHSLSSTLKTHLIGDLKAFGIESDDYDKFIKRRSEAIAQHLNVKLSPKSA